MQHPPILLEDGWSQINQYGLKKLFHIIETGSLQEQGTGNGAMRSGHADGSASSSSSSSSVDTRSHSPPAQGFTNEEYAKLYTSVGGKAQMIDCERLRQIFCAFESSRISLQLSLHCASRLLRVLLLSIIYQMCIQKAPHCWTPHLYERYDQSISEYLSVRTRNARKRLLRSLRSRTCVLTRVLLVSCVCSKPLSPPSRVVPVLS